MSTPSTPASLSSEALLLPCPFCGAAGGDVKPHDSLHNCWSVSCSQQYKNGCLGNGPMRDTKELAIAAWNTRAAKEQPTDSKGQDAMAKVRALVEKWREDAETLQRDGQMSIATSELNVCADELEAALAKQSQPADVGTGAGQKQENGNG